jgi:NAD(P)-dependent dehydrogenase (short-subunit alcohol dehydrogenase family)
MLVSLSGKRVKVARAGLYAVSKFAALALCHAVRHAGWDAGVRATAICPGFVATDMTEFVQGSIPPEEMMQPEDIAEAVSFLLNVSPACAVPQLVMARPVAGAETQGM